MCVCVCIWAGYMKKWNSPFALSFTTLARCLLGCALSYAHLPSCSFSSPLLIIVMLSQELSPAEKATLDRVISNGLTQVGALDKHIVTSQCCAKSSACCYCMGT